ncbi:MAG: hypothetical protein KDI82_12945, partial [Gammaproteobacteria bacterium]|nr:hypothetical protein [Gammaproteobacteria bacterium]
MTKLRTTKTRPGRLQSGRLKWRFRNETVSVGTGAVGRQHRGKPAMSADRVFNVDLDDFDERVLEASRSTP